MLPDVMSHLHKPDGCNPGQAVIFGSNMYMGAGYIQPGTRDLMCSYHGWEFNGSGKCTKIPQIDDPKVWQV